jgi:hypothetical protein
MNTVSPPPACCSTLYTNITTILHFYCALFEDLIKYVVLLSLSPHKLAHPPRFYYWFRKLVRRWGGINWQNIRTTLLLWKENILEIHVSNIQTIKYSNSWRVAAAGEMPNCLVWWVLAILCRSQQVCLFSETREVLGVNLVDIGAVLQDLRLILLELFSSVHEMCLN